MVAPRLYLAGGHCVAGENSAQKPMPMYHTDVLSFSTAVILVGASPVTIKPALAKLPDDLPLIAADGGASALLALGKVPAVVIGDMDSLVSRDALPSSVEVIHLTGQDDTDFEKCLARIDAPLIIGLLLTVGDWRLCFIASGLFCIGYGVVFILALVEEAAPAGKTKSKMATGFAPGWKIALGSMLLSTASGGFIFGAMTFVVPRYFEISLPNVSTSVAITGLLASIVYAAASFSQIGVGWLIDRVAPKWVLFSIGVGQVIFVALAARFTDYALFFAMLVAMCFVFGQIPITDTILSRYVPDHWRARVLSVKFMVNLTIGATVLPICGAILQSGYEMAALFTVMSILAVFVVIAGALLPVQADAQRLDRVPAE